MIPCNGGKWSISTSVVLLLLLTIAITSVNGLSADVKIYIKQIRNLEKEPTDAQICLRNLSKSPFSGIVSEIFTVSDVYTFGNKFKIIRGDLIPNPILYRYPDYDSSSSLRIQLIRWNGSIHSLYETILWLFDEINPGYNNVDGNYFNYTKSGNNLSLEFSVSVSCGPNIYGLDCGKFCQPNEKDRYTCDTNGDKICIHGWKNVKNNCSEINPEEYPKKFNLQVKFVSYQSLKNILLDGRPCNNGTKSCSPYFEACLELPILNYTYDSCISFGEYQHTSNITFDVVMPSPKGNLTNPIDLLGFKYNDLLSLRIDIYDSHKSHENSIFRSVLSADEMFDQTHQHGDQDWKTITLTLREDTEKLTIQVRSMCTEHYYGSDCEVFCQPADDATGHYTCDHSGNKICLPRWVDPDDFCLHEDPKFISTVSPASTTLSPEPTTINTTESTSQSPEASTTTTTELTSTSSEEPTTTTAESTSTPSKESTTTTAESTSTSSEASTTIEPESTTTANTEQTPSSFTTVEYLPKWDSICPDQEVACFPVSGELTNEEEENLHTKLKSYLNASHSNFAVNDPALDFKLSITPMYDHDGNQISLVSIYLDKPSSEKNKFKIYSMMGNADDFELAVLKPLNLSLYKGDTSSLTKDYGISGGAIVGIVLGIILVIAFASGAFYLYRKRELKTR